MREGFVFQLESTGISLSTIPRELLPLLHHLSSAGCLQASSSSSSSSSFPDAVPRSRAAFIGATAPGQTPACALRSWCRCCKSGRRSWLVLLCWRDASRSLGHAWHAASWPTSPGAEFGASWGRGDTTRDSSRCAVHLVLVFVFVFVFVFVVVFVERVGLGLRVGFEERGFGFQGAGWDGVKRESAG
eukprot:2964921-Rhodomonas_salina.4